MSFGLGNAAALKVTAVGGTAMTDISAYLTSIDPSFDSATAQVTTLGDADHEYLASIKDATLSCEGIYDPTPDAILFALRAGTAAPTRYFPQGTASGKIYFDGSAILTQYTPPANLEEAVTFSAQFQFSGALTRGTV